MNPAFPITQSNDPLEGMFGAGASSYQQGQQQTQQPQQQLQQQAPMTSFGQPPPPPSGQSTMGGPFMSSGGPPPPSMSGSMIGGPPPLSGGVGMMGRPPPPNNGAPVPFQGGGALVVSNQQSNPYAGMLGSGPPHPMAGPPPLPGQMMPPSSGMIGGPPPPPPMQPQMSQQSFHTQPPYGSGGAQQNPFAAQTPPRPGMMSQQSQQSLGQLTPQRPGFSSQQSQSSFDQQSLRGSFGQQSLRGSFGQQSLQGSFSQQPSFAQQSSSMGQQSLQFSFGQQSLQSSFVQQQQQPEGGPPPPSVPPPFPPPAPAAAPASNVFDPMAPPAPAPAPTPAFPAPAPPPPPAASSNALVPSAVQSDPWADMFGAPTPTIAPPPQPSSSSQDVRKASDLTDGTFGVGTTSQNNNDLLPVSSPVNPVNDNDDKGDDANGGLPPGGDFYDARIFTPMLGVIFFRPQELKKSLFLDTHAHIVDALADRPTVAFILEGSSARAAGVDLGHVLVKVNGIDVKNPKEASRLVKEGPRPLPMLFYAPDTNVITSEGEHMVKYNTKDTNAPLYAKDWKPKYVVIGGVIAPNYMMNMYKSKTDYDTAVRESQARRPISVKIKRFSLQGARIQNDWKEPRMVKYKNKLHPWRYFVVIPAKGHPIKISSNDLAQLKPVHEGIRRLLLEQQKGGDGGNVRVPTAKSTYPPTTSSSSRDVYGNGDGHSGSSWRGSSGGGTGSSVGGGESSLRRKTIDG